MIKKISFVLLAIIFAIIINWFRLNGGDVTIEFTNFQIITSTNFVICLVIAVCILYNIFYKFKVFIFKPENLKRKVENYTDLVVKTLFYISTKDFNEANRMQKKCSKIFNNNLSKYLEYKISTKQKKYTEADRFLKEIQIKDLENNVFNIKLEYEKAKENIDMDAIEKSANKLLIYDPKNNEAIFDLLKIYIKKENWIKANEMFHEALKLKLVKRDANDFFIISENLGKFYYDKNDYIDAKEILRDAFDVDASKINISFLLAKIYLILDRTNKAEKIVLTTWKYTSNKELLDLYYAINENKISSIKIAEKLVKSNANNFESQYSIARAYYYNKQYDKAREISKLAEKISPKKAIYELMLKIEEESSKNAAIINLIKSRI
ncbi:MAG: hypothetical protein LBT02_03730 [Rickettsiales bacterium]|jgi:uncharacterized membrane-anchored protein|nr:hypothetical protein [Rickettsiales bacterium]